MLYNTVIIGAGIAGLTASVYLRRAAKTVLLIEGNSPGGQITLSPNVENYPAVSAISGAELAERIVGQAESLGANIEYDTVISVEKTSDGIFLIKTEYGEFASQTVIIATGLKHRQLEAAGADRFKGGGISYCAVCDGSFFRGLDVAVIGGGNTALSEAIYLADICKNVYLVHRRDAYRAESAVVERMKAKSNIVRVENSVVASVNGTLRVESVTVKSVLDGSLRDIPVCGIFVALGHIPLNKPFENITRLDGEGFIAADESCTTDTDGVFVAGDCRTKSVRQLTTAAADGAVAALAAAKYIDMNF